jgi:uncharacterized repeat protein (TIGR01451 family)
MKSIFARLPKKALFAVATLATIAGASLAVHAWSPDRPTFTVAHPAPYVTFNSITDNADYGDERMFFDAKNDENKNPGGYADNVQVNDGDTMLLRVYVHNNAADNLNDDPRTDGKGGFVGIARDTQVRIWLPSVTDSAMRANAYISSPDANPAEVSDTVDFSAAGKFGLEYVPGSAMAYTNAVPSGMQVSDSIVTTGAPIGYDQLNGIVPGCFQYTSFVTIKVKVTKPSIDVQKTVRKAVLDTATGKYVGTGDFVENLAVSKGDVVQYQIAVVNNGPGTMNDVVVGDNLPPYVSYMDNTTTMKDSNNPTGDGAPLTSNNITKGGIDQLGEFPANSGAKFRFMAKVADSFSEGCGTLTLKNVGIAKSEQAGSTVSDTAVVTVDSGKTCTTPTYACSAVNATLSGRTVTVKVNTTVNGATVKQYSYNFGDGTAALVTDKNPATHTYDKDGTYKIAVSVVFTVDGVDKSVSSDSCTTSITVSSTTPPVLPNTGAGNTIGLFAAVSAAGAVAHQIFVRRRALR